MNALTVPPVGQEFRNLGEQVYRALVEAIVQWRIKPGQRLVLEELASQLKVSRTPVRDALSRLATRYGRPSRELYAAIEKAKQGETGDEPDR